MDELGRLDATAQAELVARGDISPLELIDAAIARIERLDPELNAVIIRFFEQARAAAKRLDRAAPFAGVPFLLKDIGASEAGMPQYLGNRALRDAGRRTTETTTLARRFRGAGLVTLGKTNIPEFGIQPTTQPLAFGPTRNPYDHARSPGGSSGGAAAAVATGMVALAHANDIGGSIRIPAAWCGLVGLKPSRGRTSMGPDTTAGLAVEHVLTRTVRDAAGMLDAVYGADPGDVYIAAPPLRPFADEVGAPVEALRIGVVAHHPLVPVHDECAQAVLASADLLEGLGHHVSESWPAALFEPPPRRMGLRMSLAALRYRIRQVAELLGRDVTPDDVEPYTWARYSSPERVTVEDYVAGIQWQMGYGARICSWWSEMDVLVTPTVFEPPALLEELEPPADDPASFAYRIAAVIAFTQPFNASGQPAVSLPLHRTGGGLPVGVQFVAAHGREDLLIRLAAQLEAAAPWNAHVPPPVA